MSTFLIPEDDVESKLSMAALIPAIEETFAAYEGGDVQMPPKSYIDLPAHNGDFRSMPAYVKTDSWEGAGVKWVNVHPDNPRTYDLPTVIGTMVYSDPRNAYPLAILDGTSLTKQRTGAAAAVATKHLAVADASSLGIIGAGAQSYTQVAAISEVRPIEEVVIVDVDQAAVDAFIDELGGEFDVRRGEVDEAASCDVLSTVTPVEQPIVEPTDVGSHTHINAIGADAEGKHEIHDDILLEAKLVIDDYEQCTHSGEINVPWSQGIITDDDLYAELGEIVTQKRVGREHGDGVTIFDSTGLAIQDIAAAHIVYERCQEEGFDSSLELVGFPYPSMNS